MPGLVQWSFVASCQTLHHTRHALRCNSTTVGHGIPDVLAKFMKISAVLWVWRKKSLCALPNMFLRQDTCFGRWCCIPRHVCCSHPSLPFAAVKIFSHSGSGLPDQISHPSGADRRSVHNRKKPDMQCEVGMYDGGCANRKGRASMYANDGVPLYVVVVQQRLGATCFVVTWIVTSSFGRPCQGPSPKTRTESKLQPGCGISRRHRGL